MAFIKTEPTPLEEEFMNVLQIKPETDIFLTYVSIDEKKIENQKLIGYSSIEYFDYNNFNTKQNKIEHIFLFQFFDSHEMQAIQLSFNQCSSELEEFFCMVGISFHIKNQKYQNML